jgi:hypothetical protein
MACGTILSAFLLFSSSFPFYPLVLLYANTLSLFMADIRQHAFYKTFYDYYYEKKNYIIYCCSNVICYPATYLLLLFSFSLLARYALITACLRRLPAGYLVNELVTFYWENKIYGLL